MTAGYKISTKRNSPILLGDIPQVGDDELFANDLVVKSFDGGIGGLGPHISWTEVIFRPSTNELFAVNCYDGAYGSYCPHDLGHGELPQGVRIQEY